MKKAVIAIVVIALIVLGWIWVSGIIEAKQLVESGNATILTVSIMTANMNGIKKSGFMFYLENFTDYKTMMRYFTY